MSCITYACRLWFPLNSRKQCEHSVPGWNDYVVEKHTEARDAFLEWVAASMSRQGLSFIVISKTRAAFKLALKYCRQQEDMLRANSYAKSISTKDYESFWSKLHKSANGDAVQYATTVGGSHGVDNILEMWRNHFEQLYISVQNNGARNVFNERLHAGSVAKHTVSFLVSDVIDVIRKHNLGKAYSL